MENENYTLYDLEMQAMAQTEKIEEIPETPSGKEAISPVIAEQEANPSDSPDSGQPAKELPEKDETSDKEATMEKKEKEDEKSKIPDESAAEKEVKRMMDEMGAEKLLDIIVGNRNSAIEQILSEVEASQERSLQSGTSVARKCTSIFDLAAVAREF